MKGNLYTLGLKHSEETKKKISEINLGKKLSDETRAKMSKSKKGDKNPMKKKTKLI